MIYYRIAYPNELYHHGIKGQRWGIRRFQNKDGSLTKAGKERYTKQNLRNARFANVDKWGSSPDTNILFITGFSGSGKSTVADTIARKNDKVIHLDAYTEPINKNSVRAQNKDFNLFLDQEVPRWKDMANAKTNGDSKMKKFSDEYWRTVDAFQRATEQYAKKQFKNNNRVVVEGIQIADDWFSEKKDYYSEKPLIVMGTNPTKSLSRALKRDGLDNIFVSSIKNTKLAKERVRVYANMNSKLNDLATITNAKKDRRFVDRQL